MALSAEGGAAEQEVETGESSGLAVVKRLRLFLPSAGTSSGGSRWSCSWKSATATRTRAEQPAKGTKRGAMERPCFVLATKWS